MITAFAPHLQKHAASSIVERFLCCCQFRLVRDGTLALPFQLHLGLF